MRWWLADPGKGRRDYAEAHLPGAIFVDVDTDLVAAEGPGRHPLPSPAAFGARMAAMGFDDSSDIVAYDDAGGTIAARLWWMFDVLGHPRVRLLDGGIQAWLAAGGPVTDDVPAYPPGRLALGDAWLRTIDREALTRRLGSLAVIDARAPERYRGDVEPIDPVAGHIPTAVNRPTGGNLAPDGRFLPPDELRRRFAPLGGRGRDGMRVRDHGLPQRAGDADRRAARSPALPGVLQRLVACGDAGGDRRRAGPAAGARERGPPSPPRSSRPTPRRAGGSA